MLEKSDSVSNEFRSCYHQRPESTDEQKDHNPSGSSGDHQITAESVSTNLADQSKVLPSSPDLTLKNLLPLRENPETLSEVEIESKFDLLALAYRTDSLTLTQRLESHKRQRDVAEQDASNELQILRNSVRNLCQLMILSSDRRLLCPNIRSLMNELIDRIECNIEVVAKTNLKIASRSELYGAVRQEEKFSAAFDIILLHAQNLKRLRERERRKLEEAKKFISINAMNCNNGNTDSDHSETHSRRTVRSLSSIVPPQANMIHVRRTSISSGEAFRIVQNRNANAMNARYVTSNSNRSRRVSMPASPVTLQSQNKTIPECSGDLSPHLEITAEENCDYDSDASNSPVVDNRPEKSEQIIADCGPNAEQTGEDIRLNDAMPDTNSNQSIVCNKIENEKQVNQVSDQLSSIAMRSVNGCEKHKRKLFDFPNVSDVMYNYCFKHGLNNSFQRILVPLDFQQLRLMLAIILLLLAATIVILSFVSNSNVAPHYEWRNTNNNIFSHRFSKEKVGQNHQ